jgi:hypothetical protein
MPRNISSISVSLGLLAATLPALAQATSMCSIYPHWPDCAHPSPQLIAIDAFIHGPNAKQGNVAVFDWDGTLFDENIPVPQGFHYEVGQKFAGQPLWFLWGAEQNNPVYFPAFDTADGNKLMNIYHRNDFQEGKTSASPDDYSKFATIANFPAGMTPADVYASVTAYYNDENLYQYAYTPMLDVVHQFIQNGYQVYLVSGSNPYYLISLLANIQSTMGYTLLPKGCNPHNPDLDVCHVIGNTTKLDRKGRFSLAYDDRFVKYPNKASNYNELERVVVDQEGKAFAISRYVIPQAHAPAVFYAGNSGGDYEAVDLILNQPNLSTFSIAVNPRGTLLDEVNVFAPSKMAVITQNPD